jgi:predicted amidohydrolase
VRVAAIQMVSTPVLDENLEAAQGLLSQAASLGAELAVLPEYFCLLGNKDTDKLGVQEPYGDGPIQRFFGHTAQALGLWLVGGTLPLSTDAPNKVRNSSLAFAPDGRCVARYDKIHLFSFDNGVERYDESRVLERGSEVSTFDLASRDGCVWRVGMSICYDLRFPELYRQNMRAGAHLMLVPSAFTHTTGQAHWEALLRARAIENLCFMVAPAQGGRHANGRRTWGHSMVVEPWGAVMQSLPEGQGVVTADLDMASLARCRTQLPALGHGVL